MAAMSRSNSGLLAIIVVVLGFAIVLTAASLPHQRSPPAIPPGETRGLIFTCLFNAGTGGARLRVTIDSVEVANVSISHRQDACASPLVDPGSHTVSVYCDSDMDSKSYVWSNHVEISSRQVVELPGGGLNYVC